MNFFSVCILSVGFLLSSMALSGEWEKRCDQYYNAGYKKGYSEGQYNYDCKKEKHKSYNKGYGEGILYKGGYDGGYKDGYGKGVLYKGGYDGGYKAGYDTGYKKGQGDYPGDSGAFCAFVFKFDGFIVQSDDQCQSSDSCDDNDINTIDVCLVGALSVIE